MSLLARIVEPYVSIEVRTLMKRAEDEVLERGRSELWNLIQDLDCAYSFIDGWYVRRKYKELNKAVTTYKVAKTKALIMKTLLGVDTK